MRILIVGSAGYLGSTLAYSLMGEGHYVTCVDDFRYGQDLVLAGLCADTHFDFVRGDCRDWRVMKPLVEKADLIYPLAALVGAPACDEHHHDAVSINYLAVQKIVQQCSPNQRIVYPNSNSGYGTGGEAHCTEDSPLEPISHYGKTKCYAEDAVLDHPNGCSLRFATLFGMSRRMRTDLLLNDFVWRAVNDKAVVLFEGHFRRNFLHVHDAARALQWFGFRYKQPIYKVYNIGHPEANVTKRQLCEEIAKQVPGFVFMDAPIGQDPDQRDYLVSNDRMSQDCFLCSKTLADGIAELIRGYKMMRKVAHGNV